MIVQTISVNNAQALLDKLIEIKDSGKLDNKWLDPVGTGTKVIPEYIELLERKIKQAKIINEHMITPDVKVILSDNSALFMLAQIFKKFKESNNDQV